MITYREMDISDYAQVAALWSETEHMLLRDADSEQSISHYLIRNPGLSYIAQRDKVIVGCVLVGTDGRRGYLQHLAVSNEERGSGIGKHLVSLSINALAQIGIAKTHLFVANDNLKAQAFYHSQGWHPRDEVRMFSFNSSSNSEV